MNGLVVDARLHQGAFALDAAFTVDPGEVVVIVGPNGAGKSTLLRAVAGLAVLDAGRITLDGRVLDDPAAGVFVASRRRAIGVVFQAGALFAHMRALDNVAFGAQARGRMRRAAARRVAAVWLERLGVADLADRRPAELSGGQAQRVALARALASSPQALLLDEPLSALDATTRVDVRHALREHLASIDVPTVLVVHDPVDALTLGDRIVVLESGRVTQIDTPDGIRAHPRSRYAADLVGVNLLRGEVHEGAIVCNGVRVVVAGLAAPRASAVASVLPRAITLHREAPHGSARNTWATVVVGLDDDGERVRVRVDDPVPLTVEITPAARVELGLEPGAAVWVSFKATDVAVFDD